MANWKFNESQFNIACTSSLLLYMIIANTIFDPFQTLQKSLNQIENDDMILDVGSKTIENIKNVIDNSSTILWNGPLGYFENPNFSIGSLEIAKYIGNKQGEIYSVIGGGDTVSVVNSMKIKNKFNFVSTAGGAFLEYLEGKILPGIRALN